MNEYLKKLLKALAEKNQAMQTALSKSAAAGTTPDEETEKEIQALEKKLQQLKSTSSALKSKSLLLKLPLKMRLLLLVIIQKNLKICER